MKFIKPSEISSKIMTLIDESDEFVLIISPYVKISKWYKLLKRFQRLTDRNIPLQFVVRDSKTNQYSNHDSEKELANMGFSYKTIPDLHCKLYINEKNAIMSSMNLLLSSDTNSIELAYITETKKEYDELIEFCGRYLDVFPNKEENKIYEEEDWRNYSTDILSQKLKSDVNSWMEESTLILKTWSERFEAFIWNKNFKTNYLRIFGILTQKEFEFLNENSKSLGYSDILNFEINEGNEKKYNTIWATLNIPIKTKSLNSVFEKEKSIIAEAIIEFVYVVENFKSS